MMRSLMLLGLTLGLGLGCSQPQAGPHAGAVASSPALTVPAWWVDPSNTTTCASDANTCQSSTCGSTGIGPCATVGEIVQRWGTSEPHLQQTTTITLLSDDLAEIVNLQPYLAGPDAGSLNAYFALNGSLVQTGTATIESYTPQNRVTGQVNTIKASGQSGAFWTPFLYQLVHNVTAGAWFWVEKDLGNATAVITTPLVSTFHTAPFISTPAYVTIAPGDSLVIERPTKVVLASLQPNRGQVSAQLYLQHVWMTWPGGSSTFPSTSLQGVSLVESYVDPNVLLRTCPFGIYVTYASLFNGAGGILTSAIFGGAIVQHNLSIGSCIGSGISASQLDGDLLIDTGNTRGIHVSPGTLFGRAYLNASIDLDGCFGGAVTIGTHDTGGGNYGDAFLWGPSGLDLEDSCALRCQGACSSKLLLQGNLTLNEGSTGNPCRFATGACESPVTISTAAIDDAGALCNIATGDCFRQ